MKKKGWSGCPDGSGGPCLRTSCNLNFELGVLVIYLGINEICSSYVFISSVLLSQLHFTILMLNHRLFSKELHFLEVVFLLLLIFFVHVTEEDHLLLCQSDDIYIMMKCLSVTKNHHFLLGVSCNHPGWFFIVLARFLCFFMVLGQVL